MCAAELGRELKDYPAASPKSRTSERLVWLVVVLSTLGVVISTSAVAGIAGAEGAFVSILIRRVVWFALGLSVFLFTARVDYHFWRRHNLAVAGLGVVLLAAVLIPGIGRSVNGARRWIRFGHYFGVQPSEIAKVCLIIWLAAYCERNSELMKSFSWGFLIPMLLVGLSSLLVLAEPDFGTAVLIAAVGTLMLLVAGTRVLYVLFGVIAMLPVVQKLIFESDYRRARIMIFLDPWSDPNGKGYQLIQSFIALGSGGIWGRGLGSGNQKLGFLPECSTDFAFSVLGEELGLAGTLAVLVLFMLLVMEGMKAAVAARDLFGFMLAAGLTTLIGVQTVINIGVVTGCLPPKGLSLPLISAGGSSLIFSMFALGVLSNIARSSEASRGWRWSSWELETPAYERFFCDFVSGVGEFVSRKLRRI